ncbi:MAG: TIM barrel protein [Oscillospiraceae bacterium]|jgi:predicted dehydrogenase/sugar phosphate isomerase/epimerase|nr:TIM barrel protein [Oscillospiraceae bacterium]
MAYFPLSAFADEASASLDGQIAALKANNIHRVELRGVDGKNISDFTHEEAVALKEKLDAAGIKVSAVGSKYGKIGIDEDFAPHFAAFQQTVAVADVLQTKYIRMFSFYCEDREASKEKVIAQVKAMADYAAEKGLKCCHENEKGIYGENAAQCLELREAVGENLGVIFDPSNFLEAGQETWAAYEMLKPYITYFHIKDHSAAKGGVVPAGQGDGRIAEILKDFDESNFGVYFLSIEPHLKSFEGLSAFDEETQAKLKDSVAYKTNEESFAAAADALQTVLEEVQPIKLGVIGLGNMGGSHLYAHRVGQHKYLRVTAVADINPERFVNSRNQVPEAVTFDTAEELIDSGLVNAILIATPHYFHPPIAVYAFSKGLDVLTEKPAGVYTKQVREMNEAAAASGKVFAIMYNQRANPRHQALKKLIEEKDFGSLRRVVWNITDWYRTQEYYNSGGWRATWSGEGGGVLLNQCPHNLDLWQWLCGMPEKIYAKCHEGKWHDIEVEDDVLIYAEYPDGATGEFITTTGDAHGTNRMEITFDRAQIIMESGVHVIEQDQPTSKHIYECPKGFSRPGFTEYDLEITPNPVGDHSMVLTAFAKACVTGDTSGLYARGEEGINGLTISNAAFLSSWLGKEIALPLDEDLFWEKLQEKIASSKAKAVTEEKTAGDLTFGASS